MRGSSFCFAAVTIFALAACVGPDATLPPPIEPLPSAERTAVSVAPMRNDSPVALAAELAEPNRAMLATLFERTNRFRVVDDAPLRVETAITELADEDASESVIYSGAHAPERRRRAVVGLRYVVRDAGGVRLEGALRGESDTRGARSIAPPSPTDLETGAYWNSPVGVATRRCLDDLVRRVAEIR